MSPKISDHYVFFWKTSHPNGFCSQWYPSSFKAAISISGSTDKVEKLEFPTAEHWMMVQKALLFGDEDVARKVLAIKAADNKAMARVKGLGRKVKRFDDDKWEANRERIVFEGTLHKFKNNTRLRKKLLGSGNKIIAEVSPVDAIWGTGMAEKDVLDNDEVEGWPGLNLLGKALMEVRRTLREEEQQERKRDSDEIRGDQ